MWGGFYPRWHVTFNITMLRLLSFNMDYHWACTRQRTQNAREDVRYSLVRVHIVTMLNKVLLFHLPIVDRA